MRVGLFALLTLALAAALPFSPGMAQPQTETATPPAARSEAGTQPSDPALSFIQWDGSLERLGSRLDKPDLDEDAIETIRGELSRLRAEIEAYIAEQRPRLPDLEARLSSLGEGPADDALPEPPPITAQRAELRQSVGDLKGALKGAEEALVRVDALSERARERRRALFETRILKRDRNPLSPALWEYIAKDAPTGYTRLAFLFATWWDSVQDKTLLFLLAFAAFVIWAIASLFSYRRVHELREWHSADPPTDWQRAASAGQVILLRLLPTAGASGFLYASFRQADLLTPAIDTMLAAAIASLVIVTTVQAVIKTSLAITRPQWRLLELDDRASFRLYHHLMLLAAIYGVDVIISAATQVAFMPVSISVGQSFLSAILFATPILSALRIREEGAVRPVGPRYLRLPLLVVALFILGAGLLGYVSLARFVAGQLIVVSTILIVTYLLIISVSAFGDSLIDAESPTAHWLEHTLGLDRSGRERLALPIMLLLKGAAVFAAIVLILLLWGFDAYDIVNWLRRALLGFEIGGFEISILAVIIALLLFAAGYVAAKLFQRWLDSYVMERTGVDAGVRDSVRTGVGYLGVAFATILAISYLGLDFSNLAIVAGALSVGVGFGLQSIVNNFVSGLILLAERPIKAGDWVIVGAQEGIVRKISVRSTEIETFDRANVIVPNSMLISETVKNWTLHNSTGRMPIPVGVHYSSDPEQVRSVLLSVARDHPQVLSNPEPFVFFEDFAQSSLNFTLFVYLANVSLSFAVRTDLRIAILKAFRENGIEIPYPQTDVHLRDLDWLKDALKEWRPSPRNGEQPRRRNYKSEAGETDGDGGEGD